MRPRHLDDEMAQHRVAELERVFEFCQRLVVALDVHEHVVRFVDLGERVGKLAPALVFEAVNGALPLGNQALVSLDHLRNLLALVGMDDENDLVMPHSCLLMGKAPQWFGHGAGSLPGCGPGKARKAGIIPILP